MKTIDLCKHTSVHEYHISEVLRLIADWNRKQSMREHPDSIQPAGTQPDIIQPERKQILSNLTVLNVSGYQEAYNTTDMLIPWFRLPSLRSIRAIHMLGCDRYTELQPPSHDFDITSLEFMECGIQAQDLEKNVLRYIRGLREFKYCYSYLPIRDPGASPLGKWEPRGIVRSLLSHASHGLVNLDISSNEHLSSTEFWASNFFVGSLRRFKVLKRLRVEPIVFAEWKIARTLAEADMSWDDDTNNEERADEAERRRESSPRGLIERSTVRHHNLVSKYITDERPPQRIEKVHMLVDVLPASLEELVLCLTFSGNRKTAILFQDLQVLRSVTVDRSVPKY